MKLQKTFLFLLVQKNTHTHTHHPGSETQRTPLLLTQKWKKKKSIPRSVLAKEYSEKRTIRHLLFLRRRREGGVY